MKFNELGIRDEIVRALADEEIIEATSIQEKAIPFILKGEDVVGMSKTGSGKTAAFGIPILENIDPNAGLQVLILTPTRELAVQISGELTKFGKHINCPVATVFGGVAIEPQMRQIKKSKIVVGTPGRILDHLQRRTLDLSKITCFALDEADKMVEMGFIEDITRILSHTPDGRQILLFGATLSREIDDLRARHMRDPKLAKTELNVEEDLLAQYYYDIQPNEKFSPLVHLLEKEKTNRVMIFCSTRTTVEILARNLRAQKISCEMIHGKLSQNRRLKVIKEFNEGGPSVLIASAVAARGLDIQNVSHVFNYDLSRDPQEYIHRVGRTARAGESGKAFTLLSGKDHDCFGQVLQRYPIKVEKLAIPEFKKLRFNARDPQERDRQGRGQRRSFGNQGYRSSGFGERRQKHSSPGGRRWGER
jgi:superfamily II DNA/RNA helicase